MDKGSESQVYDNVHLASGYNEPERKESTPEGGYLPSDYDEPTRKNSTT